MGSWIISLLQTDAVIAVIAGAFVTYIVKWFASKQGTDFKKYEGYAITAIKAAEKAIPDDVSNKGAKKLDFALKVFLDKYTKATGVKPDETTMAKIEAWISVVHNAVEEAGTLKALAKTNALEVTE